MDLLCLIKWEGRENQFYTFFNLIKNQEHYVHTDYEFSHVI